MDVVRGDSWTPPIIPLPSDTLNLHQHFFLSPMARTHASALSTVAAQNHMAQCGHTVRNRLDTRIVTLITAPPSRQLSSHVASRAKLALPSD